MSSLTRRLRAHFWVLFSICLLATTAGAQEPPYVPGEVIVKFTPEVTAAQAGDIFAKLGAEKIKDFPLIRASLIRLNGMTVSEAISAYVGHSLLEYIEPNYLWFIDATIPDDPSFGQLWGMNNTGQTGGTIDADIDAPEAWDLTTGSRDVIVAVIDTGVDYNHPDLAANMWVNPGEIPGNGIDDDQNGWIDDIHGCDAVNQDGDPMDDHSHGTHCSGTIGGVGNNALGVAGVNWNVRIMACKFLSAGGSGSTDDAIECLEYAVAMGATLTSNSWGGGGYSLALEDAITQSYNAGQLFVAAAGNSGQDNDLYANYPSNYTVPNVVAVGATDHNDDRVQTGLWASSYGATTVDIGAPGLDILSSVPGGGYATKSGTSMATPHVAGALALLKGAFPDITVEAAKTVLIQSADKKPQLAGLWVSEGRLNVAVMLTGPDSIPPAPVLDLAVPTTASNWVDLVWTASGDDGTAGTAAAYDLRYAEFPIDPLTFEAATRVLDLPAPQETGLTESTRVSDLASNTLYYFALKVIDEYGNRSPMSNLASTTTLDAPTIWVTPGSFTVNLDTGQLATEILTVANTGQGVLDFELTAVAATLQAAALASAAADAVAGLTFSGELVADGLAGPTLSGAEIDLLNSRLSDYESVLQTSAAASSTQVIGVGGLNAAPMLALLLADPQLSAAFQFQAVDYVSGDLTAVDGLVISEADYGITEAGAASLRAFHASGRPIFLGMDDMDDIWSGSIATDLGEVFGIANPQDAEFCTTGTVNSSHPIMQGIPSVAVGGFWCNDNDAYSLDGADWLFQDGSTGRYHGVAYVGAGRSVLMGEMLEGIWATNPQLNANALMWMMEGAGLPTFVPAFGSVAAGQAVDVEVIFDAANLCTGSYPSNILVTGNDPLNPEIVVAAEMLVTGETDIEVSKQALDFGPVFVGGASTDTLRISNPGCELLMVTSLVFDHSDFQADAATLLLDPGQRQNLIVTYGPTGVGPVTATLTLYTNDPDEPVVVIDLAGEGLVAPVLDFDPVAMTASLATGQAETQTLTIRNLGGSDLEIGLRAVDASPAGTHAPSGTSTVLNPEAAPSQGPAYAEGVIPTGEPLPPPTVALGSSLGAGLDMLFVGMDTFTEISLELLAYDEINSVDVFLAGSAVPTLADLAPYDVVVLANGSPFPDPVALGNVLADYIDQGGGVIQTLASFAGGFEVAGRFMTGGYAAFGVGYGPIGDGTLGTFDPTHPIMDGVTWAWCDVLATTPLMGGAQLVASYDIGEACIATQGEHVVGFNVFLPESYYWTGDVPLMLRNSAIWLSGQTSWLRLDPAEGIVPPGGQLQVQVTFDATELCTDTYLGEILIASNDPLAPAAVVPAEMFVQGEPDIAVSDSLIAFGEVFLGASVADTLIVSNPGCDLLVIDAISTDDPQFSVVPAALALAPEAQGLLVVTFTPTSLGAQAAVLRLESNDPDDPVIDIPLSAECVAPPVAGVSPARLAAILAPGESEIQTLTISNTGSADLVWSLRAVARDSLAGAMQAAAAEAVAGLVLQPAENSDGEQILALAPDQLETLQSRLADYRAAADQLGATGIMKLLGVTGNSRYDLLPLLLGSPELASMYLFQVVDYAVEDLTGLDGLIVAETDYAINETRALALRAFSDSGKPILLGMDDLDDVWMGTTPGLLGPIFGISDPYDADFCSGPVLNPDHPINEGLPGFNMGGSWCNDNDAYHLDAGEWLFRQTLVGNIHGVANAGQSRAVLMGENLAWIWAANPDLNANAVIWLMEGGGVPGLDPRSGVLPAGNQQEVAVTFDATNLCGGIFPSDILLESNDPLNRTLVVPAELTVTGEPDIALSDSLLDFGQVFVGATPVATLRIFNRACGLLEIASIASDDVHFAAESGPLAIPGGESYPLEVFFYAGVPGTFTGTLTMISNDPDESVITVPLRGSAVMGPEIAVDPKSFLVELAPGGGDTRTLTIENLGGTDLDWSIAVTLRDTMALALRAAAAEVVADLVPEDVVEIDGGTLPAYSSEQIALIGARLPVYQDLVEDFRLSNALPVIGVGGYYGLALLPHLLANPQLAGAFGFVQVDILTSDLTDIAGLIISELDATLSEPKAQVIRDFSDSGRPIFLGMDDLDDTWFGTVPSLLGPVFGISIPLDGDLCTNPMLNTAHPILAGISGFNLGGAWCIDNDHYLPTTADWLFADGANGYFFGVANEGLGLTVLMGENLTQIWDQNEQLNTNAVFWMMEGSGLPSADPRNGTIAPGASTPVTLTFKAPDNCGGNYLSSLLVTSNDPVNPVVDIPVEVRVPGEPNISISDTLLAFGETFVGYSRQDTVSVINNGCEVLDVTAVTIAPGAFAVDTAPFTLAVGGTHDLVVAFAPAAQGPVSGSLTLASNDGDSPTVTVALSGTGTLPPAIGVDPGSLAATVAPGETVTKLLTVSNTGDGDLYFQLRSQTSDKAAALPVDLAAPGARAADRRSLPGAISLKSASAGKSSGGTFASGPGSGDLKPAAKSAALAAEVLAESTGAELDILILGSGDLGPVRDELLAFPEIVTVDIFDTRNLIPELDDLLPYNVVILANNNPFKDPVATGNVVAAYVDLGGGVIQTEPSFIVGYNIEGRFWDEGYSAFGLGTDAMGNANLGTYLDTHPIMEGVVTVWGDLLCQVPLAPGASWVAYWDDGRLLAATQGNKVVGLNLVVTYPGHWGGQAVRMIRNAALWIQGSPAWLGLPVTAGQLAPGGSAELEVVFDPRSLPEGQYSTEIMITSNDPAAGRIIVPVTMEVGGGQDMWVRIDAAVGPLQDLDNTLGIRSDATDGYDLGIDLPEPSPPPSGYLSAYFPHPEWMSPLGERFTTDYRAPYDPGQEARSWDFRVQTDRPDTVHLDFEPGFTPGTGWQLWLHDWQSGRDVNLWPDLRYSYLPGVFGETFTITVGELVPELDPVQRTLPAGWSLVGAPLVPLAGLDTWGDVLLDDSPGVNFLFSYEGQAGYANVDGSEPLVAGQGLWVAATDSFVWTMEGEPAAGPVHVPLREGWNLLGYPLWFGAGLDGIIVEHGGFTYSWAEAYLEGLVSGIVYDYDTTLDDYFAKVRMEPWRGYWLAAHRSGVVLNFDAMTMLTAQPVAIAAAVRAAADPKPEAITAETKTAGAVPWQLAVRAGNGPAEVLFGRDEGATAGFDAAFDLPAPPASPSGAARTTLTILHPEWALAVGDRFVSDIAELRSDPGQWSLVLRAAEPGPLTLTWDGAGLPEGLDLEVYLPAENRVAVSSVRAQGSLQVETDGSAVTVVFRSPDGISEVPWLQAGLQLRNVPNPFNPSTDFRFNLPEAGAAEVWIYNLRGALVRRLSAGVLPAGPAKMSWAGRDNNGSEVASGVYFYRLFLDGRQLGDTHKMSLIK